MTNRSANRPPPDVRALFLAVLAFPLAGCGADPSRVLARVGDRTLTTDEFIEVARDNQAQYPGPPDSAKALLLDDMVRRALMLCDAQRLGMDREPAVAASRERFVEEEAEGALYRRLVPADVPVSEAEVERLYAWRDTAVRARAILCASRGAADAAAAELARGAPFGEIANRYSAPGAVTPGGDLGYLLPGSLVQPLERHLREGPLGTVIGPIESPDEGWFLFQVLERRKHEQRPLEEQREMLREMLRQRKVRALHQRAQRALRETYRLRPEPGGAQALFALFNRAIVEGAARDLAAADSAERAVVLARYDAGGTAGVYTVGDAIADLNDATRVRPDPAMIPSIERWIDVQALRRLGRIEARRRHLDQEPETVRRVARRVDNLVLDLYYDVEIAHGGEATLEDLREAYERNRPFHQRLDGVELLVVTLPDSARAQALVLHSGHAPSLREAVEMASPGARVSAESVRYPGAPERWKGHRDAFLAMMPGQYLGPIPVRGGWLVAQLVSKRQEAIAIDQLPPAAVQSLRQQAEEIRRDRTFDRKTEALRREFQPQVRAERLRALPWPIAGPGTSPG